MSENITTQEALQLRDYELTVVFSAEVSEENIETSVENIKSYVTSRGGEISDVRKWGKRRLAYPIKHLIDGYYVLFLFKMKPEDGSELENNLRISEEVLRHLLINND